jgi:anti-sigma factor RsiW
MSCSRHETGLFLHAHNQLGGVRRWVVESHIHACPVCRARWAQWTVERDRLRRAFSPMPPDPYQGGGVSASVAARIRVERPAVAEAGTGLATPLSPRAVLLVAAVIAMLAVGVSALAAYWRPAPPPCPMMSAPGNHPAGGGGNGPACELHPVAPILTPAASPALPAAPLARRRS